MSVGMNDLLGDLSSILSGEEVSFAALEGMICGEIEIQRMKRGMNQKQFAEFMGVTQSTVSKWERGECNFTLRSIVQIACKLELPLQSPIVPTAPPRREATSRVSNFPGKWSTAFSSAPSFRSADEVEKIEM